MITPACSESCLSLTLGGAASLLMSCACSACQSKVRAMLNDMNLAKLGVSKSMRWRHQVTYGCYRSIGISER
jgi:hypothetical protein